MQDKAQVTEYVYEVPCSNCDKTYIGNWKKVGVRL